MERSTKAFTMLALFWTTLVLSQVLCAQRLSTRMTNQDVIEMVSMGLPDDVVTDKIQASANADFDTSVAGLKTLKAAHVSDRVIRSMINFRGGPAEKLGTTNAASNELPQEAGVYLMSKGNLMASG
jgi:hypothetical protein